MFLGRNGISAHPTQLPPSTPQDIAWLTFVQQTKGCGCPVAVIWQLGVQTPYAAGQVPS